MLRLIHRLHNDIPLQLAFLTQCLPLHMRDMSASRQEVFWRAELFEYQVCWWVEADRGLLSIMLVQTVDGKLLHELRWELPLDGVGDKAADVGQKLLQHA